MIKLTI